MLRILSREHQRPTNRGNIMEIILNHYNVTKSNRPLQTRRVGQPLWLQWVAVIIGAVFLNAGATATFAQSPSPSPSPGISPSPSPSPGISPSPSPSPGISPSPSPSPGPSCSPIANASMSISGGGGPFNPTSLTINPSTRVTWTNVGNNRARVRDVGHVVFDSGDLDPGQAFSFTFCVSGHLSNRGFARQCHCHHRRDRRRSIAKPFTWHEPVAKPRYQPVTESGY